MRLDEPHGQAIRERPPLDLRKGQSRGRAQRRWLRAIGRTLGHQRHEDRATKNTKDTQQEEETAGHFFTSGSTTTSTRRSAGNHRMTAACASDALSDVYRARSSAK